MTTAALSIAGLKKVYADGFTALKGIDLEVKEGGFLRAARTQRRR